MGAAKGKVAVWVQDEWARVFLGVREREGTPSRWVCLGKLEESTPDGLWVHSGRIEEWKSSGKKTVIWSFTPPKLLLRWPFVLTVQDLDGDDKGLGFRAEF